MAQQSFSGGVPRVHLDFLEVLSTDKHCVGPVHDKSKDFAYFVVACAYCGVVGVTFTCFGSCFFFTPMAYLVPLDQHESYAVLLPHVRNNGCFQQPGQCNGH